MFEFNCLSEEFRGSKRLNGVEERVKEIHIDLITFMAGYWYGNNCFIKAQYYVRM